MPTISVNNTALEIDAHCNISDVIFQAGFSDQSIAIALNGEFIPRANYSTTSLTHGDNLDIVKPIGGG